MEKKKKRDVSGKCAYYSHVVVIIHMRRKSRDTEADEKSKAGGGCRERSDKRKD